MVKVDTSAASRSGLWSVLGALCRYGLAGIWLYSGFIKMLDPLGFRQSVQAYELFPPAIEGFIAQVLPPTEFALGLLLLLGLFLRPTALVTGVIMLGFMAGISSAWARGLEIDCGCFSTDHAADSTTHVTALIRDLLFLIMAWWVWKRPFTRWALHP
ncbi:DoxX family membrane protein [Staphylococcus chromogenes]|nr:DoxX family membrane protein [Staphylococcus chromogenes]